MRNQILQRITQISHIPSIKNRKAFSSKRKKNPHSFPTAPKGSEGLFGTKNGTPDSESHRDGLTEFPAGAESVNPQRQNGWQAPGIFPRRQKIVQLPAVTYMISKLLWEWAAYEIPEEKGHKRR